MVKSCVLMYRKLSEVCYTYLVPEKGRVFAEVKGDKSP